MRNDQQGDAIDLRTERRANQAVQSSTLVSQQSSPQVERVTIQQVISTSGVSSVAGTANQINVSAATGAVTFSLPQNIHTGASPTFADLILSAPTRTATRLGSASLNVNTNTKQALFTVPAGKSAIILAVVLRSSSADLGAGLTSNLNFGFNAGAKDWTSGAAIDLTSANLTGSTKFLYFGEDQAGGGSKSSVIGAATDVFGAITDVAYGSAATVTIDVWGYLF